MMTVDLATTETDELGEEKGREGVSHGKEGGGIHKSYLLNMLIGGPASIKHAIVSVFETYRHGV